MGERPLTCVHEIPEALDETSSNGGAVLGPGAPRLTWAKVALAPAISELRRKLRREMATAFFDFTQFSGSVFLRTRIFGRGFPLQPHFALGVGFASGSCESSCELIMSRRISRLHLHVRLQWSDRVGKFARRVE